VVVLIQKLKSILVRNNSKTLNIILSLNSSFKIPTWYGIEIKAGFDNNEGVYLNPGKYGSKPRSYLTWVTQFPGTRVVHQPAYGRCTQSKMQMQLSQAERKLQAIAVLYDASIAYFNWKKKLSEVALYQEYNSNAQIRFKGIQS
jgi:hypothetical protein